MCACSSLQFAHRLYWYLLSHASKARYSSEVRDEETGAPIATPLHQAVMVYGSWAGTLCLYV